MHLDRPNAVPAWRGCFAGPTVVRWSTPEVPSGLPGHVVLTSPEQLVLWTLVKYERPMHGMVEQYPLDSATHGVAGHLGR
jgi:hypothetical protein